MASGLTYVDSSALVKLVFAERESAALRAFLAERRPLVTSQVAVTEVGRAAQRVQPAAAARRQVLEVFDRVAVLAVTRAVAEQAVSLHPPALRTLDALHLAAALSLGTDLGVLVAYDRRLLAAARAAGVAVASPA